MRQTFATRTVWEPLYRMAVEAAPLEVELFRSEPVRRLKHLRHFGAAAVITPVVHSRFELKI
ncbi:hypothetical protein [Paenibacillus thermotolerans]|uniref:hypothetical protein n=1 Tax=Paenibacillus thermotolerans TaxID=3027807 RepID=UPI00236795DA|nr:MULTISPECIES: hypothetical protein [unclassified Paenibacillus]